MDCNLPCVACNKRPRELLDCMCEECRARFHFDREEFTKEMEMKRIQERNRK